VTAFDLIDSIFSRVQDGMPSNMRRVTPGQFAYLRDLIGRDPEGGAVHKGMNGSIIYNGVAQSGGTISSGGAAGDFGCVLGVSSTQWDFTPSGGSW